MIKFKEVNEQDEKEINVYAAQHHVTITCLTNLKARVIRQLKHSKKEAPEQIKGNIDELLKIKEVIDISSKYQNY